jgi:hypothetical protein
MRYRTLGLALALAAAPGLIADEGMWTFDNLPLARMKADYGFAPDQAWLDHLRLSVVRFPGGTGSFISDDGLVLTNHHVGHGWIEKVSDKDHDFVANGFVAADRSKEIPVAGLELATLESMENVSESLAKAVPAGTSDLEAARLRRVALDRLLEEARTKTGLTCEPVSLYQGGETWIYGYKMHKDVRLVMAPEYDIAAFGKDWDNFSFPRHDLDFSLFRVYEDGKPYHPAHHLAWAASGPQYGEMTLLAGHPGRTSRLETLAQMEAYRDVMNPLRIRSLDRTRKALHAFAAQGGEHARLVSGTIMGTENAYKVYVNETLGLKDTVSMAAVARAERELRDAVAKDPTLRALAGASWDQVAAAMARRCKVAKEDMLVGKAGSSLLGFALGVAECQEQAALPEAKRRPGFRTAKQFEERRTALRKAEILDPALEQALFAAGLQGAQEELGAGHSYVTLMLQGRKPGEAAQAILGATRLGDAAVRASLLDGKAGGDDPLLVLARKIRTLQEPLMKVREETQAILGEHGARIARARFQVKGKSVYPDATFSLRLSFGAVKTYPANGTLTQPFTTFGGLYDRADAWGPEAEDHSWKLPQRWVDARGRLDMSTHFDFISTNDIIGGNSGSAVVSRKGEVVGLVFDGNIESNAGCYFFNPDVNRAVAVDASAILTALDKVYAAPHLVKEILAR